MSDESKLIVCRCENITVGDLREIIGNERVQTVNQVKKLSRAGMGACQGRTCSPVIELLLERKGCCQQGAEPFKARPPVRSLPLITLASQAEEFKEPQKTASKA